jgi:hypothetical protein
MPPKTKDGRPAAENRLGRPAGRSHLSGCLHDRSVRRSLALRPRAGAYALFLAAYVLERAAQRPDEARRGRPAQQLASARRGHGGGLPVPGEAQMARGSVKRPDSGRWRVGCATSTASHCPSRKIDCSLTLLHRPASTTVISRRRRSARSAACHRQDHRRTGPELLLDQEPDTTALPHFLTRHRYSTRIQGPTFCNSGTPATSARGLAPGCPGVFLRCCRPGSSSGNASRSAACR